jgi:cellulose biosynthesis protein BcsQ
MTTPLVIAVASGKGGVGKTMLSVAIANEMARARRTLLLDLDFFNRGLTGLFSSVAATAPQQPIEQGQALVDTVNGDDWSIATVGDNLQIVRYGDVDRRSSTELESAPIQETVTQLMNFVDVVTRISRCEVIVFDCHGGPDSMSFAACIVAKHSILVSEPDKITLYGTLNFLRSLELVVPDRQIDIRLVFNKVIPAFGSRFLFRFYQQLLAEEFRHRDLLAIYPLEPHLTKAFEKTPFLTTAYPTSQLAEKTRLLLHDLLARDDTAILPPAIATLSRFKRFFSRYYMGRWPAIFELDLIFRLIALVAIVLIAVPQLVEGISKKAPNSALSVLTGLADETLGLAAFGIGGLFLWLVVAAGLKWARDLDIFLTYGFRTGALASTFIGCVTLALLGLSLTIAIGLLAQSLTLSDGGPNLLAIGSLAVLFIPPIRYALRGIRNIRFDRRYAEGSFRIALACALPALGIIFGAAF